MKKRVMRTLHALAFAAATAAAALLPRPGARVAEGGDAEPPRATLTGAAFVPVHTVRGASSPAPVKRPYVVAVMGDSLSAPKSHGGKYLEYLHDRCPRSRFYSWAKGGNMVSQMRKRFLRDVFGAGPAERPQYTHVLILGGIADIGSNETANRTVEKIQADLGAMYAVAHERGAEVVALTLPPWGGFPMYNEERHRMMMELNDWIRSKPSNVAAAVDIYPLLSCGEPRKLCEAYGWQDKLHWSKAGHDVVGAELYARIFSDCE